MIRIGVIIVFMVIITLLLLMLIQQNDSVGVARNNKLNYFVAFFFRMASPVSLTWQSLAVSVLFGVIVFCGSIELFQNLLCQQVT